MTATVLAWMWALLASAAPPAVRLAPVSCGDITDATVRPSLRVELGHRLLEENAAGGSASLILSIACHGSDATLVVVHQSRGVAPIQRLLHLGDVAPEARPQELALVAVELVHVADLRDAAPPATVAPPAAVTPPATGDRTFTPPSRQPRSWTLTINSSLSLFGGGYFADGYLPTDAVSLCVGVEHGPQRPASPSWQWALTTEVTFMGGRYQSGTTGGLMALVQRRGRFLVPELGFGARAGYVSSIPTGGTTTSLVAGGPVASVGVSMRFLPAISFDVALQTGYDVHGPGGWIFPNLGYSLRL